MTREDQVEKILDELEEEFAKANMPVNDKLTLFAKVSNAIYKCAEQEPCEDAISRQAVIEVLNKMDRYVADELTLCDTERKFPQNEVFIVDDVYEEIVEQLPPVKPAEKVGQWIKSRDSYGNNHFTCPFCEHDIATKYDGAWEDNYCSNCGAKMQEVKE